MLRTAGALIGLGTAVGAAVLIAQGPLPGDVAITRGLQTLFGDRPGWAEALTATARVPAIWGVVIVAAGLAFVRGGPWAAIAVPVAFGLAFGSAELWRLVLVAPRPTPDLVAVASPGTSSGLPSTFALYYGALGAAVMLARARTGAPAAAALVVAGAAVIAGCAARIVLGGHWTSQMLASASFAAGLAALAHAVIARMPRRPTSA
ncbi:MAG: hypothetical protein SFV21_05670 [Rhodospirillaceae bacterium]|nr:hypothetical protein [Rhodospirillaceae bacterium]